MKARDLGAVNSPNRLVTQLADGSTDPITVLEPTAGLTSFDWSADSRCLVNSSAAATAGGEGGIWYHERAADGSLSDPVSYVVTPASENQGVLSPDGRYLAYRSNELGRYEVYVRPFPSGPGKWQVSTDGGV